MRSSMKLEVSSMTTARTTRTSSDSRRRAVANAVASTELEGGTVSPQTRADMAEFEAGRIDTVEVMRRVRARYGAR
jgi:hypothetical protein